MRIWLTIALVALVTNSALADCGAFFKRQVIVQQVAVPVAVPLIYYQTGQNIQDEAYAERIARLVAQKLTANVQPQQQNAPPAAPQTALAQHCAKCHSGATPKGGIVFDGTTLLECRHVTAALRQIASDKMPKDHKIPPEVKGALMDELLSLERKEEVP